MTDDFTFASKDEKLLKHITSRFDYMVQEWRETREEGHLNMRYVAGDPWDPEEKRARKASGRPCLALDELGQYVNKAINDLRQNKRAIEVSPKGSGANDETARLRQGLVREIETECNAPQSAYTTCFENQVQRNIGYVIVRAEYVDPMRSSLQRLVIERVANPDTVYIDPDCKRADYADAKDAFVIEEMTHEEFRSRWPKASIHDFSTELQTSHPAWIKTKRVQVAEYWRVEAEKKTVFDFEDGVTIREDELPEGTKVTKTALILPGGQSIGIKTKRQAEEKRVFQYITNGVEILEKNPWGGEVEHADGTARWHGKRIPIGVATGKEIWLDEGTGAKRKLLSAVSLARDPYMLYCYYRTNQAEFSGMIPKVPAIGYEGQFEGHEAEWQGANRVPIAFLQAKGVTTDTGQALLPLPQPRQYDASPIMVMDQAAESARRAIQAAFGMYEAAVGKSDARAKSGIAIQRLQEQSQVGTFHFRDNHDLMLTNIGEILDDLIPLYYDTAREAAIRGPDDQQRLVQLNQPTTDPKTGEPVTYETNRGEHDVTVKAGPSYQDQRQEAQEFADLLLGNQGLINMAFQAPQSPAAKILGLAIRLRNLGPIGDEMADAIDPSKQQEQPLPPQVQQLLAQMQEQLQALDAYAKQVTEERDALKRGEQVKALQIETTERIAAADRESKEAIEAAKADVQLVKIQAESMAENLWAEIEELKTILEELRSRRDAEQQHELMEHQAALQPEPNGSGESTTRSPFGKS